MINSVSPTDWKDLQNQVAQILSECGFEVDIEKDITTARDTVNIDVHAVDPSQKPATVYLCECKYWKSRVPKTVVHAFRTVVHDYGANWGLIISSKGFQQGAYDAAQYTNVQLLSWKEFQQLFVDRWYDRYFVPHLYKVAGPLAEYAEPINSRILRKADALTPEAFQQFRLLREKYQQLATLAMPLFFPALLTGNPRLTPPLRVALSDQTAQASANLPQDLLDARSLREFLEVYILRFTEAVQEFDQVVDERA